MNYFRVLTSIVVLVCASQATVFVAGVSQDSISVGDRILFNAAMLIPKGAAVVAPPTENGFGKFVIKEWNSNKVEKSNVDSLSFNYIITLYTPEQCTLPPVPFVQVIGEKRDTFFSKAMTIRTVFVKSTDTSNASNPTIAGLKPQQSAGSPSLLWLWIVLAVCGLVALVLFLKRFIKKKHKAQAAPVPKPPYEEAMEALALLESKQYLVKGMVREYVFALSDIFKRYLERRFEVHAAEFTTEEMLDWIRASALMPEDRTICEWFFFTADPVKFAKWLPENETLYRFGGEVRKVIERTKPIPGTTPQLPTDTPHAA